MSIEANWADANQQTIIHISFSQTWTWDEFHQANQSSRQLAESVPHRVDFVFELAEGMVVPSRVLSNVTLLMREREIDNINRVILIGANGLVKNLMNVLRTLYPAQMSRVVEAQTYEHALRLLAPKAQTGSLA